MRLVSPFLKHLVIPGLSKIGHLRRAEPPGPIVVTYHGVLPDGYNTIDSHLDGNLVTADAFRSQLRFLTTHYKVISPDEFRRWCIGQHGLPPRAVLLTCDDGLLNSLTEMLPILQEFRLLCLFFVTGASLCDAPAMLWFEELYLMFRTAADSIKLELVEIGKKLRATGQRDKRRLWWDLVRQFSRYDLVRRRSLMEEVRMQLELSEQWNSFPRESPAGKRFRLLSRSGVRQLAAAGMCVGAHTSSHLVLSQSPAELAWREIGENRQALRDFLDREIWALSYPFGDTTSVSSREARMAERAGFECAFLNIEPANVAECGRFLLPRVHVTADMKLPEFEAHISGLFRSLRHLFRTTNQPAAAELPA